MLEPRHCRLLAMIAIMGSVGVSRAAEGSPGVAGLPDGGTPSDTLVVADEVGDGSNSSFVPIPFYYYTPETSSAFGVTAAYTFRPGGSGPAVKLSSVRPTFIYTTRDQILASLGAELYPFRGRYRVGGEVAYLRFPTFYWGIGNDTPDAAEEPYTPRLVTGELEIQRRLGRVWYVGGAATAAYREIIEVEPGGLLDRSPGTEDGRAISLGVLVTRDSRDNIVYPTAGSFLAFRSDVYSSRWESDFEFTRYTLDVRGYGPVPIAGSMALRAFITSTAGSPPFDLLPQLGGDSLLRGYFEGRFRDRHLAVFQCEYRLHVWRRWGLAGFVGAGQVTPTTRGFRPDRFWLTAGGGIRFQIDPEEGLNVRADFGMGENTSGFYLGFGEAF